MFSHILTDYYYTTIELFVENTGENAIFQHFGEYESGMLDKIAEFKSNLLIVDLDTIADGEESVFIAELRKFKMTRENTPIIFFCLDREVGDQLLSDLVKLAYYNILNFSSETSDEDKVNRLIGVINKPVKYMEVVNYDQSTHEGSTSSNVDENSGIVNKILKIFKNDKVETKSTKNITVLGVQRMVGTTHTALILAYGYQSLGFKNIALINNTDLDTFSRINDYYYSGKKNVFKHKGVVLFENISDYYKLNSHYDIVIFDCGTLKDMTDRSVFNMSKDKFLVSKSAVYHQKDVGKFFGATELDFKSFTHLLPYATKSELESYKDFFGFDKVYSIPFNKDYIKVTDEVNSVLKKLI